MGGQKLGGSPQTREAALELANRVMAELARCNAPAHVAGSLRRGKPICGDIDVLAVVPHAETGEVWMALEKAFGPIEFATVNGKLKRQASFLLDGAQIDLYMFEECELGAGLCYLTGSMQTNVVMRKKATNLGMMLNQYGLWRIGPGSGQRQYTDSKRNTYHVVASATEADVFEALNMTFIPPEKR